MLMETTSRAFQVGDTVQITATKQTGRIVAFQGGRWKVLIDGAGELLKESCELERRQALFG